MKTESLLNIIDADFYTGVPDSQLKSLCDFLFNRYGISQYSHVIASNEGNAVALAAGYYLSTRKVPVVYMQNSGEGNAINPIVSLLHDKVYAIPVIFIIGWRGEPGVHDEPQHIYQGEITLKLLEHTGITYFIISKDTKEEEVRLKMKEFRKLLEKGRSVAFVLRKGALETTNNMEYKNCNVISRESAIEHIVNFSKEDPIISTTGKASRELFEIRERLGQSHKYDFLTVGSMGHCSSIALGIAINKPNKRIWCIDGDGAMLMHLGALPVIGFFRPNNFIHIIINNSSHESVGGMPTVSDKIDICSIAKACGYKYVVDINNLKELDGVLSEVVLCKVLSMIVINCNIFSRSNLGRPTISCKKNKDDFMDFIIEG